MCKHFCMQELVVIPERIGASDSERLQQRDALWLHDVERTLLGDAACTER